MFYREKPLFGFDIGHGSIKVVQLSMAGKRMVLDGYGTVGFEAEAIRDGEVIDYETVAAATAKLFKDNITGSISTNSAAISLPVSQSFSRVIRLPVMPEKDVLEAIRLEAEQYIPIALDDLYIDYQLIHTYEDSRDYLVAASPKRVVDSYMKLFDILGIDVVVMEPSIMSVTRVVRNSELSDLPTLVIDCGSISTDLIIYDRMSVQVTGTVKFGGNTLTKSLMDSMSLTELQANTVKSKYGLDLSKKQAEISKALEVPLRSLTTEIRKIIRYFEDRGNEQNSKVEQIIILGGGGNLPGFSSYITNALRIPTRLCSIWQHIDFDGLQPPNILDTTMYATAAGLALITPKEVIE